MKKKRLMMMLTGMVLMWMCFFGKTEAVYAEVEGDFEYRVIDDWEYNDETDDYEIVGKYAKVIAYMGESVDMVIPEQLGGYAVEEVCFEEDDDFQKNNQNVESITFPVSVTFIYNDGLISFSKLNNYYVHEGNNIYSAEDGVLYDKNKVEIISIPPARTGRFVIPEGVKAAYFRGSNITEVYMSSTYGTESPYIDILISNTLWGSAIQRIEVSPDNEILSSYEGMLYDKSCEKLYYCPASYNGEIKYPDSIKTIGSQAFAYNTADVIEIPEGVTAIEESAFSGCTNMKKLTLPSTLQDLDEYFMSSYLECEVTFPNGNDNFYVSDGILYGDKGKNLIFCQYDKKNEKTISIPEGVTVIGRNAFWDAKMESISLPDSLCEIKNGAFYGCDNLKELRIPKNVTGIGCIYHGSGNLKDIYIDSDRLEYIDSWFAINEDNSKINVYVTNKQVYDKITEDEDYVYIINLILREPKPPIELDASSVTLYTGKAKNKCKVKATLNGVTGTVKWKSSNTKVAKVQNGTITAVKKGTAVVTASVAGNTAKVKVVVKVPDIKVIDGSESINVIRIKKGKTAYYPIYTNPYKSGVSLYCSASGKKLLTAKVSNDTLKITGKKKGIVKLKLTSGGNSKVVTVKIV